MKRTRAAVLRGVVLVAGVSVGVAAAVAALVPSVAEYAAAGAFAITILYAAFSPRWTKPENRPFENQPATPPDDEGIGMIVEDPPYTRSRRREPAGTWR
jgi:hypothetical protein